jgi:hypothetical protein
LNQHGEVVLQYQRKIMVAGQGDRPATTPLPTPADGRTPDFPGSKMHRLSLPVFQQAHHPT